MLKPKQTDKIEGIENYINQNSGVTRLKKIEIKEVEDEIPELENIDIDSEDISINPEVIKTQNVVEPEN